MSDKIDVYKSFAASQQAAMQREREQREALLAEYGPDRWKRGTVLIFRPHPEEADQEARAAVKVGPDRWTLTARGGVRSWAETLVLAGPGHLLMECCNERDISPVLQTLAVSEDS